MKNQILICHYNDSAFWPHLNRWGQISNILIYNKSNNLDLQHESADILYFENKGREGYVYLDYIINHYDNLPDKIFFMQDDTDNHVIDYDHFYNHLNRFFLHLDFYQYPAKFRKHDKHSFPMRKIVNGVLNLHTLPSQSTIAEFFKELDIPLPYQYEVCPCAFFGASKDKILKFSKEQYQLMQNWVIQDRRREFALEHIWAGLYG